MCIKAIDELCEYDYDTMIMYVCGETVDRYFVFSQLQRRNQDFLEEKIELLSNLDVFVR